MVLRILLQFLRKSQILIFHDRSYYFPGLFVQKCPSRAAQKKQNQAFLKNGLSGRKTGLGPN